MGSTLAARIPSLDEVQVAIDRGDRREARIRSDLILNSGRHFMESAFWYQRASLQLMLGNTSEAMHCISQAQGLAGWTVAMDRLWEAKLMAYYINPDIGLDESAYADALQLLRRTEQQTLLSSSSAAWCASMRGSINYKMAQRPLRARREKGLYREKAYCAFAAAESIWQQMDEAEVEHEARNHNRFLWFLTAVQGTSLREEGVVERLLSDILTKDGNPRRKRQAFYATPTLYVRLALRR